MASKLNKEEVINFVIVDSLIEGFTFGETDDFCTNITKDPVHIHDLNATILNRLGIDHTKLTYRYQGRDFRLTDVEGTVVEKILA